MLYLLTGEKTYYRGEITIIYVEIEQNWLFWVVLIGIYTYTNIARQHKIVITTKKQGLLTLCD